MDTGFIDALLKNFKRCEGRKEDDKNSIDRCCGCRISGIWICLLVRIKVGAESEKEYMKLAEKRGKEQQCDK